MKVFSREEVGACLDRLDIVSVVADALRGHARGAALLPAESHLQWRTPSGADARSLALHASVNSPCAAVGIKIINSNPSNVGRGLPRASGVTLLFDGETGVVTSLMPAEDISAARTAAVSTIALLQSRPVAPHALAVIGCGPVGDWHVRLLSDRCPDLRELVAFDRVPHRIAAFVDRWTRLLPGWKVWAAADAKEAVATGDVVVTATTTRIPYIGPEWLRRGTTVLNVSLDDIDERVFTECDRLFVDDWASIVADQHRILGRLARAGRVVGPREPAPPGARNVDGTIGELLTGAAAGRRSPEEVVVVNAFGTALGDIALAAAVAGSV